MTYRRGNAAGPKCCRSSGKQTYGSDILKRASNYAKRLSFRRHIYLIEAILWQQASIASPCLLSGAA